MAGEALTTEFMLGTATVMLGTMGNLYDLTPSQHSLGLVKTVKVTSTPTFVDLKQGIRNQVVYSVKTENQTKVNFDVYEYTGRNLNYALGLSSTDYSTYVPVQSTTTGVTASGALSITVASGTGFTIGSWIVVEDAVSKRTFVRKLTNVVGPVLTFTNTTNSSFPIGTIVRQHLAMAMGSVSVQPFIGCKIKGETAAGDPATLFFGKCRITSDFMLGFQTNDFSSIPFELTVYDLVATDSNYADFSTQQGYLLIS
jgi:hypothetical protein